MASADTADWKDVSRPTIFHTILSSPLLAQEMSYDRLWQEGQVLVFAGTLTSAWILSVGAYHILATPRILSKLKTELAAAIPDPASHPSLTTLEQLPYLSACIQEALRLGYGTSSRVQRIAPDESIVFNDGPGAAGGKDWVIPPGTPVGMTPPLIHHDKSLFPDSYTFWPERWLENPQLERYLVSYSKGSRQCLGINLANAELYLTLGRLFRCYGTKEARGPDDMGVLELFETGKKDVEMWADMMIPVPEPISKGIRVKVGK
jgi:cytochrome P450